MADPADGALIVSRWAGWLYDWGAHTLDQILILADSKPVSVYAFAHYHKDRPSDVEDYINCTVTFESGLTAATVIGYINKLEMPRWYIIGDRAALQCDGFDTSVRIKGSIGGVEGEMMVPLIRGDWKCFYQNIADKLAGRTELVVQPEQLLPQIAIAEAAYRSVESGQAVRVEW